MQWVAFLLVIGLAIFAVQNSSAPPVHMSFFFWSFDTSLAYALLGSVGVGILLVLFFWIPRSIRASINLRRLKKEKEELEMKLYKLPALGQEEINPKA